MSGNDHLPFGLSANTPQYEYQGTRHFLSALHHELDLFAADQSKSQYILFTGVSTDIFRRDFANPTGNSTEFEIYSIPDKIIIVKMESHTHAWAHEAFDWLLHDKLIAMPGHLDKQIRGFASAHVEGDDHKKRADKIYQPKRLPRGRSRQWPSVVLETGYTEGQRKLNSDIEWWITQSKGDVKSAMTIAVNPKYKEIVFCQWYSNGSSQQKVYRNVLSQNGRGQVKASNPAPLTIPFEHLLLRPRSKNEEDIVITTADLEEFAKDVWEVQFET